MEVRGQVAPGFERVQKVFEEFGTDLGGGGGSFAAVVDGRAVAVLSAGEAQPGKPWEDDTLAVLFSASKGFATLAAQVLADRGQLDIDTPVGKYWPEFAQNGKQDILVRHVLSHTSGVVTIPGHENVISRLWDGSGFERFSELAELVAAAPPSWDPGTRHGYQALTYGWLIGEIVRRVTGQSAGAFLREEVAGPWELDLHLGCPQADLPRVAKVLPFLPPPESLPILVELWNRWLDPLIPQGQAFLASHDGQNMFSSLDQVMNSPRMLQSEFGSGAVVGTSRGLARMYCGLARGGELDGKRLLRPETVEQFAEPQAEGVDEIIGLPWVWSLGYHRAPAYWRESGVPSPFGPSEAVFGHAGAGGQVGFADPDAKLGVGFVRNSPTQASMLAGQLVEALYRCL